MEPTIIDKNWLTKGICCDHGGSKFVQLH